MAIDRTSYLEEQCNQLEDEVSDLEDSNAQLKDMLVDALSAIKKFSPEIREMHPAGRSLGLEDIWVWFQIEMEDRRRERAHKASTDAVLAKLSPEEIGLLEEYFSKGGFQ